jgi:hypothetical protein
MTPRSEALAMLGSIIPEIIDADAFCQIAEDAVEQDLACSMTDGLVFARGKIEQLVARALDRAWNEAIERHVTPRSVEQIREEAEVLRHITVAQADDTRRVLSAVGEHLREVGA